MIICAPVDEGREPICWKITKVETSKELGVLDVTAAQDLYDPHRDYIGRDPVTGRVTDMIADYYSPTSQDIVPQPEINPATLPNYHIELSYNSPKPVIKVRGSMRKFTAKFIDKYGNELEDIFVNEWKVEMNGVDVRELDDNPIEIITSNEDDTLTANQIKVGTSSDAMLGQIVTITAVKDGLEASHQLEIVGM